MGFSEILLGDVQKHEAVVSGMLLLRGPLKSCPVPHQALRAG